MALTLPTMTAFKTVPMGQKVALLSMVLVGIAVIFYYYIETPHQETLTQLTGDIGRLDQDIQINRAKARSLEDLKRVNAELEQQLAKNLEQLPPEDEAATARYKITPDWKDFRGYFARLEKQGIALNVASYVGSGRIRMCGMGADDRAPTPDGRIG